MAYNAKTRQIETWQHSNNEYPRTDYYHALDATDDNLFRIIIWIAQGCWQARKWQKQLKVLFSEFPELIEWRQINDSYGTYDDNRYLMCLADMMAKSNKAAIVGRFRELAKIA